MWHWINRLNPVSPCEMRITSFHQLLALLQEEQADKDSAADEAAQAAALAAGNGELSRRSMSTILHTNAQCISAAHFGSPE